MKTAVIVTACIVAAAVAAFITWQIVRKHRLVKKIEADTGVPIKRRTFGQWLRAHKPTKRRLIQLYATLLYNANLKGYIKGEIYTSQTTKYMCVPGLNCYSCPGAVGACPLGAFQNSLAESSVRAPYYMIGILALFGLVFARTICGFLCPVGLGQELLYKIRTPKLKKNRVTRVCSYFKYVLLVVLVVIFPLLYALRDVPLPAFCKYICPAGTFGGAIMLLLHPDNASMFGMLGGQFVWKFSLLVVFIVASIFIFRFFCRFFCPLGAIYGFFNRIALLGVKVDKENCTDCGKCVTVCKMDIKRVGDHECINCGACIPACPTQAIRWKGSRIFLHKSEALQADSAAQEPSVRAIDTVAAQVPAAALSADTMPVTAVYSSPAVQTADSREIAPEPASQTTQPKQKRTAAFWVKLAAVVAALALLAGALIYYNFIDVPQSTTPPTEDVETGYEVGELAPDFTVRLYGSDDSFTLYDHRGKLTVINFWATWCTPCVAEIPYFDKLSAERTDINVIAIHGSSTRDVDKFIADNWPDHTLTFAQDNLDGNRCQTFLLLGGASMWPLTVIVDAEGIVLYNSTNSFHSYEQLAELVRGLEERE